MGVNTFIDPAKLAEDYKEPEPELRRSTEEEKQSQLDACQAFQKRHAARTAQALAKLQETAVKNESTFAAIMDTVQVASLGQITHALYEVGGQYRRNM